MNVVKKLLHEIFALLGALWGRGWSAIANLRRRIFRGRLADYPIFVLDSDIPERNPQNPLWRDLLPFGKEPVSLEAINDALKKIASEPETKGVLFLFKSPSLSIARAQSLIQVFERFRKWDEHYRALDSSSERRAKEVVIYIEEAGMAGYVAACGADRIYMTPLADWSVIGLRLGAIFLKDALDKIGAKADVTQISPYKSAGDMFNRSEMSTEHREQLNWLLDGIYDELVGEISRGRGLDEAQVRSLIDQAPLTATEALDFGLVDGLGYEDQLPKYLGTNADPAAKILHNEEAAKEEPATLKLYPKVRKLLLHRIEENSGKSVGVISLKGSIMMGSSRETPIPLPLLGSEQMGSETVQQQVRAARENKGLDAVVLHVDSGGGSALASDLMWRELVLLNKEKPLVVYLGDVAASGGYYVAMGGRNIVAQPTTITGSIGVINMRLSSAGAFEKIGVNRDSVQRGENADYMDGDEPWTPEQRAISRKGIEYVYGIFKERVAEGRALQYDQLDPICMGRVWTGTQARDRGLVDELGDIHLAIKMACNLADLPTDGSVNVVNVPTARKKRLAAPMEAMAAAVSSALGLSYVRQVDRLARSFVAGDWVEVLGNERHWLLASWLPKIK